MTKEELQTKIEEAHQQIAQARETLKEHAKDYFQEIAKSLFETYPQMESFSWQQYTPYFNDGDTCEFSAHVDKDELSINDIEYWDATDHDAGKYPYPLRKEYEHLSGPFNDVANLLARFEENDLKEMFGDHASITVTRGGIEVSEYDHD
jgi:hypothetical protein